VAVLPALTVAEVDPPEAAEGAANVMPAPLSGTVGALPGTLLAIVSVAVSMRAWVATKTTLTLQVEPAATVAPKQLPDAVKSAASAAFVPLPLTVTEEMVMAALPELVTVTVSVHVAGSGELVQTPLFSNCVAKIPIEEAVNSGPE
jgi:hypothetical protein